jgi:hypothetical protein
MQTKQTIDKFKVVFSDLNCLKTLEYFRNIRVRIDSYFLRYRREGFVNRSFSIFIEAIGLQQM